MNTTTNTTSMAGELSGATFAGFALAGRAIFTVEGARSRYTFRVRASDDGRVHFVDVLSGSDNTRDYSYIGFVRGGAFVARNAAAPSSVAFAWLWAHRTNPSPARVHHVGRCGRCGRMLTVPESIANGLGPECVRRLEGE